MKKNRKILAVAGAAVLVIAIGTASVLGVSAHAKNTAKETALKYLPADAQLGWTDLGDFEALTGLSLIHI